MSQRSHAVRQDLGDECGMNHQHLGDESSIDHQQQQRSRWFGDAVQCLCTCVRSGNGKVQWNACYAAGGLLQNRHAVGEARKQGLLTQLLTQLLGLIRDDRNYKVASLGSC